MRIVDCKVIFLSYEYTEAERWTWSGGVAHGQTACLVQVQTDAGLSGLGEINPGPQAPRVAEAAVDALKAFIVGEEPWNISSLWARMYKGSIVWGRRGVAVSVMGGVEMALWDLVGKALGRPVYELLGGKVRRSIRAYASGGVNFAKGQLEDELRSYVDRGFTAVKVRIGAPTLDANLRVAERARSAIGDAVDLLLDAGQGYVARPWSVPEAVRVARALERYAPFWLEEPYLTDEPEGYAAIRRESSIPIAGGENGAQIHTQILSGHDA
ncbi:mandelate racemase/muconate lactonizing enzyme family protein [Limnochorda pilosa]|uniref:Mandelate racemase/muconate lactonizing protein n=1 Tax=Limnochorda pilosa TaxID=1555112 RepID=A0A0K2SLR9_LIMPI|nr:mandelate racemase/muconate lactonizing enzyme family protein [Limnochorda pilosa]BAS28050.1 mandelate racemase/muconate lactonizing protein [Limnochorda pilosa]